MGANVTISTENNPRNNSLFLNILRLKYTNTLNLSFLSEQSKIKKNPRLFLLLDWRRCRVESTEIKLCTKPTESTPNLRDSIYRNSSPFAKFNILMPLFIRKYPP